MRGREALICAGLAVYVHMVLATWDRLPLLTGDVERQVHRAIAAKCMELGGELVALGGVADHVHLLVGLPGTVSIAEFVGNVKGASSHTVTHRIFPNGDFFIWQGAYGAVSVSPHLVPGVSAYITHQREHHEADTLILEWEHLPGLQPAQVGFVAEQERGP